MTTGAGIAIAGIWLAVGLVGNRDGGAGVFAAGFAVLATIAVAAAG